MVGIDSSQSTPASQRSWSKILACTNTGAIHPSGSNKLAATERIVLFVQQTAVLEEGSFVPLMVNESVVVSH